MKALVLRFSALGDVALLRPVLESVLAQNADLELVLCTRKPYFELFAGLERLEFYEFSPDKHRGLTGLSRLSKELSALGIERVLDLHGVLRTQVLCFFFRVKGLPCFSIDKQRALRREFLKSGRGKRPKLKHATERYADVFRKAGYVYRTESPEVAGKSFPRQGPIGFAPFASTPEKTWMEDYSVALTQKLLELGYRMAIFGSPDELNRFRSRMPEHEALEFSEPGKGLRAEIQSMKRLRGMIAMDSANLHLAALQGLPTLSIWGSTQPDAGFAPVGQGHRYIQIEESQLSCRPCSIFGNKPCARKDRACLLWIKPEQVAAEVVDLWPLNRVLSTEARLDSSPQNEI